MPFSAALGLHRFADLLHCGAQFFVDRFDQEGVVLLEGFLNGVDFALDLIDYLFGSLSLYSSSAF